MFRKLCGVGGVFIIVARGDTFAVNQRDHRNAECVAHRHELCDLSCSVRRQSAAVFLRLVCHDAADRAADRCECADCFRGVVFGEFKIVAAVADCGEDILHIIAAADKRKINRTVEIVRAKLSDRTFHVVLGQVVDQCADAAERFRIGCIQLVDKTVCKAGFRRAGILCLQCGDRGNVDACFFACGDDHIKHRGDHGCAACADAVDIRDLGNDAGRIRNRAHHLAVCTERVNALAEHGARAVEYADDRSAVLDGKRVKVADLFRLHIVKRALHSVEVLREHEDQAGVDRAVAADHALVVSLVKRALDISADLDESSFVQDGGNRLPCADSLVLRGGRRALRVLLGKLRLEFGGSLCCIVHCKPPFT